MIIDGVTGMAVSEERIQSVMRALDAILDESVGDDWNNHLRKVAIAAIEAE